MFNLLSSPSLLVFSDDRVRCTGVADVDAGGAGET